MNFGGYHTSYFHDTTGTDNLLACPHKDCVDRNDLFKNINQHFSTQHLKTHTGSNGKVNGTEHFTC